MIVKCEQCQTRFKIPDDKVTDKGVKVRCTKCSHTFRVTRDMAQPATVTAPAVAPAAGAGSDPFAKFGTPAPLPHTEVTRPGVFALGVEATRPTERAPAPAAAFDFGSLAPPTPTAPTMPAVPVFVPQSPPASAGFDFAALGAPPAAAAPVPAPPSFDFSSFATQPVAPLPAQRPPPPPPAQLPPPKAFDFSAVAPPAQSKPAPSPFDFAQVAPPAPAAAPAAFDFAQVAPPPPPPPSAPSYPSTAPAFDFAQVSAGPSAAAPAAASPFDFGGSASASGGGADGFFAAPADSAPDARAAADARAMFDLPPPPPAAPAPSLLDVPPPEVEAPKKAPVPAPMPSTPSPVPRLDEPARRRSAVGIVVNVVIAALLVFGLVVVGSAYLNEGKLSAEALSLDNLKNTFAPSVDFVANDVSNGLYETKGGRAVFFVRGEVQNRSEATVKVVVKAEIVEDGKVVRSGESFAGEPATPEELHLIDSSEALEALKAKVERRAIVVPPGQAATFVVPFTEYPPDLKDFRVRVSARAVAAATTAAAP
jgi:predicted Zn finger-like uncharacterized protein